MILAIELVKDKPHRLSYLWQERRGRIVYVITEDEIRLMAEVASESIERATAQ